MNLQWLGRTTHTRIFHILIGIVILYLVIVGRRFLFPLPEGFSNNEDDKYVIKRTTDIYDDFYANIYNKIFEPKQMAETVAEFIITYTQANPVRNVMLDVGSGTGEQMAYIQQRGFQIYGVERSQDMVEYALKNHPDLRIKQGT